MIHIEIKLDESQEREILAHIDNVVGEAFSSVKSGNANPWIKGKSEMCKWLMISPQTLNKLIVSGLPFHYIDDIDITFFNKDEVTVFMLNK